MRYINAGNLRPGLKLASNLIHSKSSVLLRKGVVLTHSLIKRVGLLGYQGLYIDDEISEGLIINDVISSDLRMKTRDELHKLFFNVENNMTSSAAKHIRNIKFLAQNIVDEILCNHHAMINLIDLRTFDDYTYCHSLNVTVLSVVLGTALRLSRDMIYELAIGALIHDTGKMFIEKEILNKPDKLSDDEFSEIKKHSELGYRYICNNPNIPDNAKTAILHHHEQYNGCGYPNGLAGEAIHLFGRIIAVADVYDALTSDRPYRKAMLPSDAIEYIMGGYGTTFDPMIVRAFTKKVAPYPIGTCVMLSTGDLGIVIKNYEETSLRPLVKIIANNKPTNKVIDLSRDRSSLNITVMKIVNL